MVFWVVFSPEWATYHTMLVTKWNVEYPFSWHIKRTPKTPSDPFRVWCPQSKDCADLGQTRHVNQFQHAISQSCVNIQNWSIDFWMLLKVNKFGLADSCLSSIATLFRVRLSLTIKGSSVRQKRKIIYLKSLEARIVYSDASWIQIGIKLGSTKCT